MLLDGLEKHEIDIALAYEVHERPGLLRVPLVQEETLFVAAPGVLTGEAGSTRTSKPVAKAAGKAAGKSATRARTGPTDAHADAEGKAKANGNAGPALPTLEFAELARFALVMPGPRDGVRQQVLATARRLAMRLDVILDVSSVSMMKHMVANGDAAAVMPYGNVVDEIARGHIVGRRIVNPPLARTLYLVRPLRRAQFTYEAEVLELLASATRHFAGQLGVLATPLDALRAASLSDTVAALQARAQPT